MKFKVDIIESERGWGRKVVDTKDFDSADDAWKFVNDFNKDNNEVNVPDWYMAALEPVRVE